MSKKPTISMIAAVSTNGVIGRDQGLPWHVPEDLKYFKEKTYGAPVVMGRKTYEAVGRLLPGRKNVIITRSREFLVPGAVIVSSIEDGIQAAIGDGNQANEIFILGGGEIYRLGYPFADRIYITEIDVTVDGDTHFPNWPKLPGFREVKRDERPAKGEIPSFRFLVYDRG